MRAANLNLKSAKCELLVDLIFVFESSNLDAENDWNLWSCSAYTAMRWLAPTCCRNLASFIILWSVNNCESQALLAIQNWPTILFVRGFFVHFHIKSIRSLKRRSVSTNIIKRIMDILWCHSKHRSRRQTSRWKLAFLLGCAPTPVAAPLWFHFIYLFICSRDFLDVVNFSLWPHSRQCSVHVAWVRQRWLQLDLHFSISF